MQTDAHAIRFVDACTHIQSGGADNAWQVYEVAAFGTI